jgi:hypothetical protein
MRKRKRKTNLKMKRNRKRRKRKRLIESNFLILENKFLTFAESFI